MDLALFDLDNTLLAGDSDYEWARFLIDKGVVDGAEYGARNDAFYREYQAGTLDITAFLDFQLEPLSRHPVAELNAWHEQFMAERIRPLMTPAGQALVRRHLAAGDLCAVVTATNSFVTAPITRAFGVPHLVATEPEMRNGRYTGKPSGTPCFQAGKIIKVKEWLQGMGSTLGDFPTSWFYSDSRNDVPLLEQASSPVAVDPDDTLRGIAAQRGWRIISLRDS